jgi:hypothetical protein
MKLTVVTPLVQARAQTLTPDCTDVYLAIDFGVCTRSVEGWIILICMFKRCVNIWTCRYYAGGIATSAWELHVKLNTVGCGKSQCCRFLCTVRVLGYPVFSPHVNQAGMQLNLCSLSFVTFWRLFLSFSEGVTNHGRPSFVFWPWYFHHDAFFSSYIQKMYQFTRTDRRAPSTCEVHRSLHNCETSVRNFLVTLPVPRIWR